MQRNLYLL